MSIAIEKLMGFPVVVSTPFLIWSSLALSLSSTWIRLFPILFSTRKEI